MIGKSPIPSDPPFLNLKCGIYMVTLYMTFIQIAHKSGGPLVRQHPTETDGNTYLSSPSSKTTSQRRRDPCELTLAISVSDSWAHLSLSLRSSLFLLVFHFLLSAFPFFSFLWMGRFLTLGGADVALFRSVVFWVCLLVCLFVCSLVLVLLLPRFV